MRPKPSREEKAVQEVAKVVRKAIKAGQGAGGWLGYQSRLIVRTGKPSREYLG
jgi:hypothetical protein